eukprot:Hpha_TRINITY_DN15882_c1_g11::TRINITY_DN15882_c1_g11_i1::g.189299::m.189299
MAHQGRMNPGVPFLYGAGAGAAGQPPYVADPSWMYSSHPQFQAGRLDPNAYAYPAGGRGWTPPVSPVMPNPNPQSPVTNNSSGSRRTLPRSLVPALPCCAPFAIAPQDDPGWLGKPEWQNAVPRRQIPGVSRPTAMRLIRKFSSPAAAAYQPSPDGGISPEGSSGNRSASPLHPAPNLRGLRLIQGHISPRQPSSAPALSRLPSAEGLSDVDDPGFDLAGVARPHSWPPTKTTPAAARLP